MVLRKVMTKEMNPCVWFGDRALSSIPRHFVKAPTPLTMDSREWVLTQLKGRYSITEVSNIEEVTSLDVLKTYIFFEDSAEAMLYELRWSGNN